MKIFFKTILKVTSSRLNLTTVKFSLNVNGYFPFENDLLQSMALL